MIQSLPLETLVQSFLLVFAGEMGDKTQLLSLVLARKYRKPWTILAGVLVATLLNHALAAGVGDWLAHWLGGEVLRYLLSGTFFVFAVWILFPDQEGEESPRASRFGVFVATAVAFFIAEMGDKTQLATVALGARFSDVTWVTLGSTLGMLASNALAVFWGERVLRKIPMQWVRRVASVLFAFFGVGILLSK
jgi:putative Ca2+/H+ antiporter (TMEM165/GDT1 family)